MTNFVPCTPEALIRLLGEHCLALGGRIRVAVDGPPAAEPRALADQTAQWLRHAGRPAAVVDLQDYVLPAAQRFENGREDPDSYANHWFDYAALAREVLDPVGAGTAADPRWLPRLRDAVTDRSIREPRQPAPPGLVLLVAGPMLLGRWLDFDVTVQLRMDAVVLRARTPPAEQFTVAALTQYQADLTDEPDLVVRYNHPDRPAWRQLD